MFQSPPFDPKCGRYPNEISEYVDAAEVENTIPDDYVRWNEGTFNPENGHFLCTACYIAIGMPSGPRGWRCP